jgi:ABC-type lipoprotein export system ATPase subunit
VIRLDRVSKKYATAAGAVAALDDVSLEVGEGEFIALRGPSGCGKSTLLMIVGGMTAPTSGDASVFGRSWSTASPAERASLRQEAIGFVFQTFHLLPYLSALDNVLTAAKHVDDSTERRAKELLDRFGMSSRISHRPPQLSVGERQRTALARAMLNEPKLILADEPTGNLDPENGAIVLGVLADFQRSGGTVLLATHEESLASRADRTILLRAGRLVNSPSPV